MGGLGMRGEMRECRCVDDVVDVPLAVVAGPAANFNRSQQLPRATAGGLLISTQVRPATA